MYDRFSVAVVVGVVLMLLTTFIIVIGYLDPNAGTAPPYLEPPVVTEQEAEHAPGD